jgi:hypothetical protein
MIEKVNENGDTVQDMLITYSEEDQQQHKINKANASLVFSPKFIPIYPELLDRLTYTEAAIFGFIDFIKSNSSARFYYTNEQLGEICRCSPDTASRAMSKLVKVGLIKTSRKIKSGGGQIRFVTDISYKSDSTISTSRTRQKLQTNKNKIKENKINNSMCEKAFEEFWSCYPVKKSKKPAKDKFMKLPANLKDEILSAVEKQKKSDSWIRGYIPHPTTWLNQERWKDEVEQVNSKVTLNDLKEAGAKDFLVSDWEEIRERMDPSDFIIAINTWLNPPSERLQFFNS